MYQRKKLRVEADRVIKYKTKENFLKDNPDCCEVLPTISKSYHVLSKRYGSRFAEMFHARPDRYLEEHLSSKPLVDSVLDRKIARGMNIARVSFAYKLKSGKVKFNNTIFPLSQCGSVYKDDLRSQ